MVDFRRRRVGRREPEVRRKLWFRRRRGGRREPGSPGMAVGPVWAAAGACRRGKIDTGLAGMALPAGAGALLAGAAAVALLSAALVLYELSPDAGTRPRALGGTEAPWKAGRARGPGPRGVVPGIEEGLAGSPQRSRPRGGKGLSAPVPRGRGTAGRPRRPPRTPPRPWL